MGRSELVIMQVFSFAVSESGPVLPAETPESSEFPARILTTLAAAQMALTS